MSNYETRQSVEFPAITLINGVPDPTTLVMEVMMEHGESWATVTSAEVGGLRIALDVASMRRMAEAWRRIDG